MSENTLKAEARRLDSANRRETDWRLWGCYVSVWNGTDPILKERLYGVAGGQGNHGEDVKEYYYYLDNTPTHSYMKYLYKYPHQQFPYDQLHIENARRDKSVSEYELLDTGVFDDNQY